MFAISKFYKVFFVLVEETGEYTTDEKFSGNIRLYYNEDFCTIDINASNISIDTKCRYDCYLYASSHNKLFRIGFLSVDDNVVNSSLKLQCPKGFLDGINIEEFDAVAIAAISNDESPQLLNIPFRGYKKYTNDCKENIRQLLLNTYRQKNKQLTQPKPPVDNITDIPLNKNNKIVDKNSIKFRHITLLSNILSSLFFEIQPFGKENKHKKWWKVTNPVFLNRLLYLYGLGHLIVSNTFLKCSSLRDGYYIVGIDRSNFNVMYGIPNRNYLPTNDSRWFICEGYMVLCLNCLTGHSIASDENSVI